MTKPNSSEKSPLIQPQVSSGKKPVLVIHGGAGTMSKAGSTPAERQLYKSALAKALLAGHEILANGGEAMDAAVAAVTVMEGLCC